LLYTKIVETIEKIIKRNLILFEKNILICKAVESLGLLTGFKNISRNCLVVKKDRTRAIKAKQIIEFVTKSDGKRGNNLKLTHIA
jgi:hypothetical protein